MSADRVDRTARRRERPWKRPRRGKKVRADRKAQRQLEALIQAVLHAFQGRWQEHWSPPRTYKSKAHERWCRARAAMHKQAEGRWEHAAKFIVDRLCLMQPRRAARLLSLADLPMLDPQLYFPTSHGHGQMLDLDKATVVPMELRGDSPYAPSMAALLEAQRKALLEAGYVPQGTVKSGSAKSGKTPL